MCMLELHPIVFAPCRWNISVQEAMWLTCGKTGLLNTWEEETCIRITSACMTSQRTNTSVCAFCEGTDRATRLAYVADEMREILRTSRHFLRQPYCSHYFSMKADCAILHIHGGSWVTWYARDNLPRGMADRVVMFMSLPGRIFERYSPTSTTDASWKPCSRYCK